MDTWIMSEGKWMHIAITFDSSEKKTYINGELWSTEYKKSHTKYSKCFTDEEIKEMYNRGVDSSNAI